MFVQVRIIIILLLARRVADMECQGGLWVRMEEASASEGT
jgi:hypothetical protein